MERFVAQAGFPLRQFDGLHEFSTHHVKNRLDTEVKVLDAPTARTPPLAEDEICMGSAGRRIPNLSLAS